MPEPADRKNDFNLFQSRSILLAQIDGTPKKYTLVYQSKHRMNKQSQDEKKTIKAYIERTGKPPPPSFDTLKMVFHVIDDDDEVNKITLEVDMARFSHMKKADDPFSFVPINDAGQDVAKELVAIQNTKSHAYELFYKKDLESFKKINGLIVEDVLHEEEYQI